MNKLILVEVAGFFGAAIFGVTWLVKPEGNWEPIIVLFGLVGVAVEIARRTKKIKPEGRFETNGQRIQHRESLRKKFEAEIYKCRAEKLRQDAIIRHVDRVDKYPDTDANDKGISPWFPVALMDTYERGIVLCLRVGGLVKCEGGFRFPDYINGEEADLTAWLMGDVPYDSIEAVNMDGDKYYYFPHIYCYFDFNGQPYERLWFCEKNDQPHGHPYFKHIAEHDDVVANNPPEGTLHFA